MTAYRERVQRDLQTLTFPIEGVTFDVPVFDGRETFDAVFWHDDIMAIICALIVELPTAELVMHALALTARYGDEERARDERVGDHVAALIVPRSIGAMGSAVTGVEMSVIYESNEFAIYGLWED
jgi:hypothetical protein